MTTNLHFSLLIHFQANLPEKPYVSSDLTRLTIRPRDKALNYEYIQPNNPFNARWLVFDIDRGEQSYFAYEAGNLASPNLIIQNPENGNCHALYMLQTPVWTRGTGSRSAENYLNAIRSAYTRDLGADYGYSGLICKNPLHKSWKTSEIAKKAYTLDELADYTSLELSEHEQASKRAKYRSESQLQVELGRNCSLFDELRYFAYQRVSKYRDLSDVVGNSAYVMWLNALESQAREINSGFNQPLPSNEIRHTARSVAKWTWHNYTGKGGIDRGRDALQGANLSDLRDKQVLAAKITHRQRKEATEQRIRHAVERLQATDKKVTQKAVVELSGVSLRTVKRHWNIVSKKGAIWCTSDSSPKK